MEKELYFIIEDKKIYLEKVLVDYIDIPIFFLCKDRKDYYVALCTDIEESVYVVVHTASKDVYCLLHGMLPMRNIILKQKVYWNIISDEDVHRDIVEKHFMEELDSSCLPEQDACFQVLTNEMEVFLKKFDDEFFQNDSFMIREHNVDVGEILEEYGQDIAFDRLESYIKMKEISVKDLSLGTSDSETEFYESVPQRDMKFFYKRIYTWACMLSKWIFVEEDCIAA